MIVSRAAPIALAALLALAGPAAADEGQVTAGLLTYDAAAVQEGGLALFFAHDATVIGEDIASAQPWLEFTAASVTGAQYTKSQAAVAAPPVDQGVPMDKPEKQALSFIQASGHLAAFQPQFQIHVYSVEGTLPYRMESTGGELRVDETVRMGNAHVGQAATGEPPEAEPSGFALVERPGPWLVHDKSAPRTSLAIEGNFVVEMMGLTLAVSDAEGNASVESGTWRDPLHPAAPPQENAYVERTVFVRLAMTDATLSFATEGGEPYLVWATGPSEAAFEGPATLLDVNGWIDPPGAAPPTDLEHQRYVVPGGSLLTLSPGEGQIAVGIAPAPASPNGGTIASVPAPASAALVGAGAVLALAIAVGLGLARRLLRLPALADVETAIEEGKYGKAARLAARILSRLPGSEEALLGRAIALTKGGRPQDVVAELTRHLALHPASDGTLHYVLGLAQLDAGQHEEGQASLREAVRLTPSLQAEVAPRLGKAFSVAPTTTREAHGYA